MSHKIQFERMLNDIFSEKALRKDSEATQEEIDEAWKRVCKHQPILSEAETRSLFKVLIKKYESEKAKGDSNWKLYHLVKRIYEPIKIEEEEEEQYEMIDVQEDDDCDRSASTQHTNSTTSSYAESDAPLKSKDNSPVGNKEDKPLVRVSAIARKSNGDEKKVLNSLINSGSSNARPTTNSPQVMMSALQKKGILIKKSQTREERTNSPTPPILKRPVQSKTIQMSESIKRKLSEECAQSSTKKAATNPASSSKPTANSSATGTQKTTNATTANQKATVNLITIPAVHSSGNLSIASSSTNGCTTVPFDVAKIKQELDEDKEDIKVVDSKKFDYALTPTFFKNLCNSSRYESFGLYVATVLNRLPADTATKLEASLLKTIVSALSETTQKQRF